MEEVKLLVFDVLSKVFGEDRKGSFEGLPAEFYRIEPDGYDGTLNPAGAFKLYKDVWVGCGFVEVSGDGDEDDNTAVYAVYATDMGLCYVTIVTNDKPVFSFCKF